MRYIIAVVILILFGYIHAQAEVDPSLLQHKLRMKESKCTEACVRAYKNVDKCLEACTSIVMDKEYVDQEINHLAAPQTEVESMSELTPEQQQEQATLALFELYHKSMRELLTSGSYGPGFQMVEPAIDLTDIEGQIAGWDIMPDNILAQQHADDFDNPDILGKELILSSEVGPVRETNGIKWTEEYKSFLAGIQGVGSLTIPKPNQVPSAQKTVEYQYALNNCTEKYLMASVFIQMRYDIDAYTTTFCPGVKRAENELFTQIGREQYMAGNNPVYAAAVALGMAQSLYGNHNAFKKYHTFRTMEAECLRARSENRPIQGTVKSMSFNYDYHTWKSTSETLTWKTKKRRFLFTKTTRHTKTTVTNFDATKIGGVEIAFADYKSVPVFPGEWFSKASLRDFRYTAREAGASPVTRYFGERGTLTLLPKQLYIGVQPTISFWVSSDQKDQFTQTTKSVTTGGFKIFGIGLSSKASNQVKIEEGATRNGQTKITMKGTSCIPQLFAIDNLYTY